MSRYLFLPLAALLLTTAAAQAQAIPGAVEVHHSDLDFTKADDANTMIDRLLRAAPDACKKFDGLAARRCIIQVVAKSVVALNDANVSKAYTGRFNVAPEKVATP